MGQSLPIIPPPTLGPNGQPPRIPRPVGAPPMPIPLPPSQAAFMSQNASTHGVHSPAFNRPPQIPSQHLHQPPKESNWTAAVDNPKEKNILKDEMIADSANFTASEESVHLIGAGAQAAYTTQPLQQQHSDSEDSESSSRSGETEDLKMNKFAERIVIKLGSKYPTSPRFIVVKMGFVNFS